MALSPWVAGLIGAGDALGQGIQGYQKGHQDYQDQQREKLKTLFDIGGDPDLMTETYQNIDKPDPIMGGLEGLFGIKQAPIDPKVRAAFKQYADRQAATQALAEAQSQAELRSKYHLMPRPVRSTTSLPGQVGTANQQPAVPSLLQSIAGGAPVDSGADIAPPPAPPNPPAPYSGPRGQVPFNKIAPWQFDLMPPDDRAAYLQLKSTSQDRNVPGGPTFQAALVNPSPDVAPIKAAQPLLPGGSKVPGTTAPTPQPALAQGTSAPSQGQQPDLGTPGNLNPATLTPKVDPKTGQQSTPKIDIEKDVSGKFAVVPDALPGDPNYGKIIATFNTKEGAEAYVKQHHWLSARNMNQENGPNALPPDQAAAQGSSVAQPPMYPPTDQAPITQDQFTELGNTGYVYEPGYEPTRGPLSDFEMNLANSMLSGSGAQPLTAEQAKDPATAAMIRDQVLSGWGSSAQTRMLENNASFDQKQSAIEQIDAMSGLTADQKEAAKQRITFSKTITGLEKVLSDLSGIVHTGLSQKSIDLRKHMDVEANNIKNQELAIRRDMVTISRTRAGTSEHTAAVSSVRAATSTILNAATRQRDNAQNALALADPADQPAIKQQISDLDKKIGDASKTLNDLSTSKPTSTPTGTPVPVNSKSRGRGVSAGDGKILKVPKF
jgi:hypothetical protein